MRVSRRKSTMWGRGEPSGVVSGGGSVMVSRVPVRPPLGIGSSTHFDAGRSTGRVTGGSRRARTRPLSVIENLRQGVEVPGRRHDYADGGGSVRADAHTTHEIRMAARCR
jgi:hypothetical protein